MVYHLMGEYIVYNIYIWQHPVLGGILLMNFLKKSVDTLYSNLMGFNSFSMKSTDSGKISFNNFRKV